MKKSLLVLGLVSVGLAHAQQGNVGVNTESPRATFEIQMSKSNENATSNQGLLIPNLTRSRVAKIDNTKLVDGTIIYVDTLDGAASGKVANITEKGFYYYNSTSWVKLSGTTTATPGTPIAGPKGEDGKTILNGTSNPTNQGTVGDFYINTTTNQIFGPKTASGWGTGKSIKGADGRNGTDGRGITAITANGSQATINLTDGTSQVITLPKGEKGDRGPEGPAGQNGAPGAPGRDGADGKGITTITASGNQATINFTDNTSQTITLPKGEKGDTGPAGPQGPAGPAGSAKAMIITQNTTLDKSHNGNYLYVKGNNIEITATGLDDGFSCVIIQMDSGQVTIAGTDVVSARGKKTRKQYSAIGVVKVGGKFVVTGDAVQ